jgi:hypothetical protein
MNELARQGRSQTIAISISVILISMFVIAFYHIPQDSVDPKKFFQQIVRFVLTLALLYFLFQGKNWARITLLVLFVLAMLSALIMLFIPIPLAGKIPLLVMIIIYGLGAYNLYFSKSFKAYFTYLNSKNG